MIIESVRNGKSWDEVEHISSQVSTLMSYLCEILEKQLS